MFISCGLIHVGHRRVTVKHVRPGWGDPGTCDYWWNQEHDNRFFSFTDKYPTGSEPGFLKTVSAGLPRVSSCCLG